MGDVYNNETNNINNTCSASSSSRHYHRSSDDISLFLHQILPRSPSSTSSSSFIGPQTLQPFSVPAPFDDPLRSGVILGVDSSGGGGGALWSGNVRTRLIMSENETDHECDCESEVSSCSGVFLCVWLVRKCRKKKVYLFIFGNVTFKEGEIYRIKFKG